MQNHNFYQLFSQACEKAGDDPLLITEQNQPYSYTEIDALAARLANTLLDLGVGIGDRVSVKVNKSPEALCLYLACLRAGFVFHPLNPAYQANELEYFLHNAEPAILVCEDKELSAIEPIASATGVKQLLTLNTDGSGSLLDRAKSNSAKFTTVACKADDLAALLYSSGTTGVPKGIKLSHQNLSSNAKVLTQAWGFTEQDILLHALPIFHVHGLFVALGCVICSVASMRWLPAFKAELVIEYLPQCTVMMGVPTFYTRLLDAPGFSQDVCQNMRLFISGSAPLLEETFKQFEDRTGHRILERYGMTETNMNTSNPLDGERKPGTVGPPLPGVEIRISDTQNHSLPNGEIGNLQVRGNNVFKGYWRMPDKTAEDFTADGFFNTGDQGIIDQDGYVAIVGRSKDLIITGGLNVYPKEIELIIDKIDGVKESAVIGAPHADFGECVVAVIVPEPGASVEENDIINQLKNQIANFKVPKQVVIIDELPRNTMGKVQKNILRKNHHMLLA